jgi:hypothetical protein
MNMEKIQIQGKLTDLKLLSMKYIILLLPQKIILLLPQKKAMPQC